MAHAKAMSRPHGAAVTAEDTFGKPRYDRRLSDKVLAAFNHAYAAGAHKAATQLRSVLEEVENRERADHDRRSASALSKAEMWVAFIEARNGYAKLSDRSNISREKLDAALDKMKDAYRIWSEGR